MAAQRSVLPTHPPSKLLGVLPRSLPFSLLNLSPHPLLQHIHAKIPYLLFFADLYFQLSVTALVALFSLDGSLL